MSDTYMSTRASERLDRRSKRRAKRKSKTGSGTNAANPAAPSNNTPIGSTSQDPSVRNGTGRAPTTGNQGTGWNPSGGNDTVAPPLDMSNLGTSTPSRSVWKDVPGALYADYVQDPSLAAVKWMENMGIDANRAGGMAAIFDDLANLAPQLFTLTQQGSGSDEGAGFGSYLDFVDEFLNTYGRSAEDGGGAFRPDMVGDILFGDNGYNADSPLGFSLNNPEMSAAEQMNNLLGFSSAGLSATMPGNIASAIMQQMNYEAKKWRANQDPLHPSGTLSDYMKGTGVGKYFRG